MPSIAELVWKYGAEFDELHPSHYRPGWLFDTLSFNDNSAILYRPKTGNPIGVIHDWELFPYADDPVIERGCA